MAKKKSSASWVGGLIAAILAGIFIGMWIINPDYTGEELGNKPIADAEDWAYNDDLGKLEKPVARGWVTHILISYKGNPGGATPKDPNRTKDEARKLAEEIWARYSQHGEDWKALQKEFNEDSGNVHNEYEVYRGASLIPEFIDIGLTTEVGKARIADGMYGYHIIRRER